MKEFIAFNNFLLIDEQSNAINVILKKIENSPDKIRKNYINKTIELFSQLDNFDVNISRSIIFSFQAMQTMQVLDQVTKIKVFNELVKLIKLNVFQKKYAFSNAVSLTLRFFYNDVSFPRSEINKGYEYLLKNMKPISKGFGSRRCQVCWNKTFKDIIFLLQIPLTKELKKELYDITQLNIFSDQLGDSYDVEMNNLLNTFYKKFFQNIKDIIVHDHNFSTGDQKVKDKALQKQGIDKTIILENNKKIFIEEKFREYKFWDIRFKDILLEYISIDNKDIPGWIYTSKSDYIVIVFKGLEYDESELYIFPFKKIKKWVFDNPDIFRKYPNIIAPNVGWNTISKPVPLTVIMDILKNEKNKFKIIHKIK
jgi:hypothetical protein